MQPHIKVDMTVGSLRAMNQQQFHALKQHILNEGNWETVDAIRIDGHGDYVGVYVGEMFIGIEKDGYTHS